MKVIFHDVFYQVYASDPAAAPGRMEAIVEVLKPAVEWVQPVPATEEQIGAVHTRSHIESVKAQGVYEAAALAAGGAIMAAEIGLKEPCFGLIRPPGHHASSDSAWGFCYFNSMAIAISSLSARKKIRSAFVLDFDLHFGDGTDNIFSQSKGVTVYNCSAGERTAYLKEVEYHLSRCEADIIGISAGFDNHEQDWGGVLKTDDYREMGRIAVAAARRCGGGCFAILEGGYNYQVLGQNALALIEGLSA